MVNLTAADLTIDWAAMGLEQDSTALEVPALAGFNDPLAGAGIAMYNCSMVAMQQLVIPVSSNKGCVVTMRDLAVKVWIGQVQCVISCCYHAKARSTS